MGRPVVQHNEAKDCERCGSPFYWPKGYSYAQWASKRFCSRKCGTWNAGLTKHTDERMARIAESAAITGLGRPGWSKGKTKHTDPRLMVVAEKVSTAQLGKTINDNQRRGLEVGRKWAAGLTVETSEGIRRRGRAVSARLAGTTNPDHSARLKALYAERPDLHPNAILARKTKGNGWTAIERKVGDMLNALGVEFKFNDRVGTKWPDFKIESAALLIEADGARWHQDVQRESERDAYLISHGWRVLHLTCDQINNRPGECVGLIREALADGSIRAATG